MSLRDKLGLNKPRPKAAPLPTQQITNNPTPSKRPVVPPRDEGGSANKIPPKGGSGSAPPKGDKSQKPIEPNGVLLYSCGHAEPVANFKGMACPPCRKKVFQQRRAKKEQYENNRNERWDHSRLPDGASFTTRYDGEKCEWTGVLTVPDKSGAPGSTARFEAKASGVFRLLRELDDAYRKSVVPMAPVPDPKKSSKTDKKD